MGVPSGPMWAFMYLPKDEPNPENAVVYAIAASKKDRDRFVRERGCKNMKIIKVQNPCELGEYLAFPSEVPFLEEYKVGIGKHGEEITMLMTDVERDEILHNMAQMKTAMRKDPYLNGVFFKKKYRNALNIISKWPISMIKVMTFLYGDTFTIEEDE